MNTNDLEVKKFIAGKLNEGVSLSDIQQMLADQFDCRITFFELRMLAAELESIDWSKLDPAKPEKAPEEDAAAKDTAAPAPDATALSGKTVVEKSKLVRPGAAASGTVKFASGASAEWILDSYGRLGLDNVVGEYTEDDIKDFQTELQKLFAQGAY